MIASSVREHTPSRMPFSNLGSSFSMQPLSHVSGSHNTFSPNSANLLSVCLPRRASRGVDFLWMILNMLISSAAYSIIQCTTGWFGGNVCPMRFSVCSFSGLTCPSTSRIAFSMLPFVFGSYRSKFVKTISQFADF